MRKPTFVRFLVWTCALGLGVVSLAFAPILGVPPALAQQPAPASRYDFALVTAPSGKLYAIGGTGDAGILATVEEYDPATNVWTARANMPTPRYQLGAAAAPNGKLYAIGGIGDAGILATVEEYDPVANVWTARANMPTPRYQLGVAAAANGKLYAIGGVGEAGILSTVEEYDPATNVWVSISGVPAPIAVAPAEQPPSFVPFWVRNYKLTEMWSGPTNDASTVSFGTTSSVNCAFQVVRAQTGPRLYVRNPYSNGEFWIDADAVGPTEPPARQSGPKPADQNCAEYLYAN